jgi:hypothetical protein
LLSQVPMSHHWQFLPNVCATQKARYHSVRIGQIRRFGLRPTGFDSRIGHTLCDSIPSAGFWLAVMEGNPKVIEDRGSPNNNNNNKWEIELALS